MAGRSSGAGVSSSSAKSKLYLLQLLLQLHTSPAPSGPRVPWGGDGSVPMADSFQGPLRDFLHFKLPNVCKNDSAAYSIKSFTAINDFLSIITSLVLN